MTTFQPSTIVKVHEKGDPDRRVVRCLYVFSARGGPAIHVETDGEAGIVAGVEDRAALSLSLYKAERLRIEQRLTEEHWTIHDIARPDGDEDLRLSELTDGGGQVMGWCVRAGQGEWLTEIQPDREKAQERLNQIMADRDGSPKPD